MNRAEEVTHLKEAANAWIGHHCRDLLPPCHPGATFDDESKKIVLRALRYLGVGLGTVRAYDKNFSSEARLNGIDWFRHPSHFYDHHPLAHAAGEALMAASRLAKRVNAVRISDKGVAFIATFEGFEPTYVDDGFGTPTVGYGHIERGVKTPITRAQGLALLRSDLVSYGAVVKHKITHALTQGQLDGLISFVFNVGPGALDDGIAVRINRGDFHGAVAIILQYDHANGQQVPGLTRRRQAEARLILRG